MILSDKNHLGLNYKDLISIYLYGKLSFVIIFKVESNREVLKRSVLYLKRYLNIPLMKIFSSN